MRRMASEGEPLADEVGVVARNTTLFNDLLRLARASETRDELLREAFVINGRFTGPLQTREVEAIVGLVSGYKAEGRLIVPSTPKNPNSGFGIGGALEHRQRR